MDKNIIDMDKLNFEEALRLLEETVDKLEVGDISLEESLALFEQGQKLAFFCNEMLENASLKVEQLTSDGEILDISPQD